MNYKDLKVGQIFNFVPTHPKEDVFIKLQKGFLRIPNKFTDVNNFEPFSDSGTDVILLTKKDVYKNIVLKKVKK